MSDPDRAKSLGLRITVDFDHDGRDRVMRLARRWDCSLDEAIRWAVELADKRVANFTNAQTRTGAA